MEWDTCTILSSRREDPIGNEVQQGGFIQIKKN